MQVRCSSCCRLSAGAGVVCTALKRLQIKGCRAVGVVGVGFHKSFFYMFLILLHFLYLILYLSPFGIQKNYTSYTSMKASSRLNLHYLIFLTNKEEPK